MVPGYNTSTMRFVDKSKVYPYMRHVEGVPEADEQLTDALVKVRQNVCDPPSGVRGPWACGRGTAPSCGRAPDSAPSCVPVVGAAVMRDVPVVTTAAGLRSHVLAVGLSGRRFVVTGTPVRRCECRPLCPSVRDLGMGVPSTWGPRPRGRGCRYAQRCGVLCLCTFMSNANQRYSRPAGSRMALAVQFIAGTPAVLLVSVPHQYQLFAKMNNPRHKMLFYRQNQTQKIDFQLQALRKTAQTQKKKKTQK